MLLENGNRVFGVEPNAEMREAGERLLAAISEVHQRCGNCRSDNAGG